jgi:Leucine-rich repeat (LRR) protein
MIIIFEKFDITPISNLSNLEKLVINSHIDSIEPIKQLINLKELSLSCDDQISDISILSNFINLKKLN